MARAEITKVCADADVGDRPLARGCANGDPDSTVVDEVQSVTLGRLVEDHLARAIPHFLQRARQSREVHPIASGEERTGPEDGL